jgi:polyferredoxin
VFVRISDGSLRNGYTVKIANKTREPADFTLSVRGLPGAVLSLSEETTATEPTLTLPVPADDIGTWRVLVRGRPAALSDGSQPVEFVAHNLRTGETAVYHSVFLGPAGYKPGGQ